MLTPPGGNTGLMLCVLLAAAEVFSVPLLVAFVGPEFVFVAPFDVASAVFAAVFEGLSAFVVWAFPVSAGEVSDSVMANPAR